MAGVLPAPNVFRGVVQSCWPVAPPRLIEPVAEVAVIEPQVSFTLTKLPVSVVVAVPLV